MWSVVRLGRLCGGVLLYSHQCGLWSDLVGCVGESFYIHINVVCGQTWSVVWRESFYIHINVVCGQTWSVVWRESFYIHINVVCGQTWSVVWRESYIHINVVCGQTWSVVWGSPSIFTSMWSVVRPGRLCGGVLLYSHQCGLWSDLVGCVGESFYIHINVVCGQTWSVVWGSPSIFTSMWSVVRPGRLCGGVLLYSHQCGLWSDLVGCVGGVLYSHQCGLWSDLVGCVGGVLLYSHHCGLWSDLVRPHLRGVLLFSHQCGLWSDLVGCVGESFYIHINVVCGQTWSVVWGSPSIFTSMWSVVRPGRLCGGSPIFTSMWSVVRPGR